MSGSFRHRAKHALRRTIPLTARKWLAVAIERQRWIDPQRRNWWSVELVRDLAEDDPDAYHRFLWAHHLAYAATYEPALRFGPENMKLSRQMFFADLQDVLSKVSPKPAVESVLEVGCSLGYQLRSLEMGIFQDATILEGFDIDRYSIESGANYLKQVGSKIQLRCDDVESLQRLHPDARYSVIICTGVLMYLREAAAAKAVSAMLRHGKLVALAGLAAAPHDNARLAGSDVRTRDGTFIHNFDAMVEQAGGRILGRRWEGDRDFEGNTVYFVFAGQRS